MLELAKPVVFYRTPEFRAMLGEVLADLQTIFVTKNLVIPLTGSGTGALEAALANSVPAGAKVICLIAGRFGERWKNIAKAFGIEAVSVTVPFGQAVQPEPPRNTSNQALKSMGEAAGGTPMSPR